MRPHFTGLFIANDNFTPEKGIHAIRNGWADMVSFGRLYISNPDLAERIVKAQELNTKYDMATFYGSQFGSKGYTDYPCYEVWCKNEQQNGE